MRFRNEHRVMQNSKTNTGSHHGKSRASVGKKGYCLSKMRHPVYVVTCCQNSIPILFWVGFRKTQKIITKQKDKEIFSIAALLLTT